MINFIITLHPLKQRIRNKHERHKNCIIHNVIIIKIQINNIVFSEIKQKQASKKNIAKKKQHHTFEYLYLFIYYYEKIVLKMPVFFFDLFLSFFLSSFEINCILLGAFVMLFAQQKT